MAAQETASAVDGQALGVSLGPVLRQVCDGRLSEIEWFRASWQQGGAATGYATWSDTAGRQRPVVVKLPVGSIEHSWTLRLGAVEPERYDDESSETLPTPRVLAGGEVLGGYDLAWLVMERFEGQPMARDLDKKGIVMMLEAAAAFYAQARAVRPVQGGGRREDWRALLEKAREAVREQPVPNAQRWNEGIKKAQKSLDRLVSHWSERPIDTWCHGDLHPNNAMHRAGRSGERCALIDLALVHAGSWVEDALYLERLFWGRKDELCGVKPVSALAKACRKAGLETSFDYAHLANIRRVLTAACVPAFLAREGVRSYLDEALGVVEKLLPEVAR